MVTHKEITSKYRALVKKAGIKAGIRLRKSCGDKIVDLYHRDYGNEFKHQEIKKFCAIAKELGFKFVMNTQINPEHESLLVGKHQWVFVVNGCC